MSFIAELKRRDDTRQRNRHSRVGALLSGTFQMQGQPAVHYTAVIPAEAQIHAEAGVNPIGCRIEKMDSCLRGKTVTRIIER